MNIPKFSVPTPSFHSELKRRINDYFQQAGKKMTGNYKLYLKAGILILAFLAIYVHLVFFTPTVWLAIPECLMLGLLTAAIGFNIMHDGAHGSFSSRKWINEIAGYSLNFLGANVFLWKTKHNVIHHAYTNIHELDDDIEAKPLLRFCKTQKYYKLHRFQHWYFWAAYSLLYIWWVLFTDYKKYFTKRIGDLPIKKMKLSDHIIFWTFKALHAFLFVVLPILMVGAIPWLIGFLAYGLFTGFVLSIVFQLAHTVEDTAFLQASTQEGKIEDEWALHQLKTTANFATRNRFVCWWVGGLNFQIEHHLFPKISHIHYPDISRIIKKACQDYGFPYIEYRRTRMAIASHVSHLRNMSRK
jgi:linoleoyl-CoA desaturase